MIWTRNLLILSIFLGERIAKDLDLAVEFVLQDRDKLA